MTAAAPTPDALAPLRVSPFDDHVSKIEELLSQARVAFFMGAGCSVHAGLPTMAALTTAVITSKKLSAKSKHILETVQSNFKGTGWTTIEDYMSEIIDQLAILERREEKASSSSTIELGGKLCSSADFKSAINEIRSEIAFCIESKEVIIDAHRTLVRALHRSVRPGKISYSRADYFTLNYDTLLEDALALEQLIYVDGFRGGATGWWDPSVYSNTDAVARIFKLHGSIDWCRLEGSEVPRRLRSGDSLSSIVPVERTLIWPASTKYRETERDPHAQLINLLRSELRNGSDSVLVISGYSFGDSHINIELEKAMRESDERLTLLVFSSLEEPEGKLLDWFKDPRLSPQIRFYCKRGFFHSSVEDRSSSDLPWWQFEVLTKILEGER